MERDILIKALSAFSDFEKMGGTEREQALTVLEHAVADRQAAGQAEARALAEAMAEVCPTRSDGRIVFKRSLRLSA